jgi:hypothetical protein
LFIHERAVGREMAGTVRPEYALWSSQPKPLGNFI